jgi:hypothetical protein
MTARSIQPFYFTAIVWGEEYRGYFHDLLLASLLAPGNIPALVDLDRCRFIVSTTHDDWEALRLMPLFRRLEALMPVLFMPIEPPPPGMTDHEKMLFMSKAHRGLAQAVFEAKALGVFVTPDLVLSDGTVRRLQELAREGKDVVLCAALRFAQEGCLPAFATAGFLRPGEPLVMTGRQMMEIGLRHLHSETVRYEWGADYFADVPVAAYWWTPDRRALVLHCFSWCPLLVNYAAIEAHDTKTFENSTLDGDYIHANFGRNPERVYVSTDSDEITLISFTKEASLSLPRYPYWLFRLPVVGDAVKVLNFRRFWDGSYADPLKRELVRRTVRWHAGPVDPSWAELERRADRLVRRAARPMGPLHRLLAPFLLYYLRFIIPWRLAYWRQTWPTQIKRGLRRLGGSILHRS